MAQEDWGRAAFERILPLLEQVDDKALAPTNTNMGEAALAAIGVAQRVTEPSLYARFQSVAPGEFDIVHVDWLSDLAWGTLHAALDVERMRYVLTRARLPEELLAQASAVKGRMQACCEYHLADHPKAGPEVQRLRAGTGHRDLAADLHGFAVLYKDYQGLLEDDRKHYRASDVDDAFRLSQEIFSLIGNSLTERERSVSAQLVRAWTLLVQYYGEVSAAGRFLFRKDEATAALLFPSLFTIGRASGRPRPVEDAPTSIPDTPAAPASTPVVAQA